MKETMNFINALVDDGTPTAKYTTAHQSDDDYYEQLARDENNRFYAACDALDHAPDWMTGE